MSGVESEALGGGRCEECDGPTGSGKLPEWVLGTVCFRASTLEWSWGCHDQTALGSGWQCHPLDIDVKDVAGSAHFYIFFFQVCKLARYITTGGLNVIGLW